jgi:hypothetical protein
MQFIAIASVKFLHLFTSVLFYFLFFKQGRSIGLRNAKAVYPAIIALRQADAQTYFSLDC